MKQATNWYNIYKFDENTMTPITKKGNCVLDMYKVNCNRKVKVNRTNLLNTYIIYL